LRKHSAFFQSGLINESNVAIISARKENQKALQAGEKTNTLDLAERRAYASPM
jgi:hypothetical protein